MPRDPVPGPGTERKTDKMEFKLEEKKGCVSKYAYKMQWDEVKEPYSHIVDEVRKEAQVPGFRRGKAPAEFVRAKYAGPIAAQLKEQLLRTVADKIAAEEKLALFGSPFADEPELKVGESFSGTIFFELQPDIPAIETEGIEIGVTKREVSKKQVDSIIESLRQRNASIKTIDEGPIEEGDFCPAKLLKEGATEPKEVFLHCHEESDDLFEKSLTGRKIGDSFELTVPEGGSHEAGKYTVTLDKVVRQALPALDDDFAAKCGFKTMAEVTEASSRQAEAANAHMQRDERDDKILAALLDRTPFEVPPTLVENRLRQEIDRIAGELHRRRIDPEKANIEWDKLVEAKKPEVEKSVRAYFIVSSLIEKEKIKVSDEELDAAIAGIAARENAPADKVKQMLEKHNQLEDIRFNLAKEKVFDVLAGRAKITLSEPAAEPDKGGKDADSHSR